MDESNSALKCPKFHAFNNVHNEFTISLDQNAYFFSANNYTNLCKIWVFWWQTDSTYQDYVNNNNNTSVLLNDFIDEKCYPSVAIRPQQDWPIMLAASRLMKIYHSYYIISHVLRQCWIQKVLPHILQLPDLFWPLVDAVATISAFCTRFHPYPLQLIWS